MATWDGSCPEDPNTLAYSNQNTSGNTANNWSHFANNIACLQNVPAESYYTRNGNRYPYQEQTGSTVAFWHSSNAMSLGHSHQEHLLPNIASINDAQMSSNNFQHTISDIPSTSLHNVSSSSGNNYNKSKWMNNPMISKHVPAAKSNSVLFDIVENSTLHPSANEFVPNNIKPRKEKFTKRNRYNDVVNNTSDAERQNFRSKSFPKNAYLSDNRYKNNYNYNNKFHCSTKKDVNYKQKNFQDAQIPPKSSYKDTHRTHNTRNFNKFQNSRYYNNRKYQSNSSFAEQNAFDESFTSTTKFTDISNTQDNISRSSNKKIQENNSSLSMKHNINEEKTLMHQNNNSENALSDVSDIQKNKSKRLPANGSNYYKYNVNDTQTEFSPKRRTAATLRCTYRRNNEAISNQKETQVDNWRNRTEKDEIAQVQRKNPKKKYENDNHVSQRERLTEQLNKGTLECLVCYEHIRQTDYVWFCSNCYHVLHLKCIKKWARSSQSDNGWKCPACRDVSFQVPEDYFCFCGKMKMPQWNRRDAAHTCGGICGRKLTKNCNHKCILLCHPGSCPQCEAMVTKYCGCGRTSQMLLCSTQQLLLCDSICNKVMSCGKHFCQKKCHHGECEPCDKTVQQTCFCGKKTQEVPCRANVTDVYCCNNVCNKPLDCGKHYCQKVCHLEPCEFCNLAPERVTVCCCGQTPLTEKRESCLDPVPTCDKICSKSLACGRPSNPHTCKMQCHTGDCPECDLSTEVKCRCGNMNREIPCRDLTSKADDARCAKRCKKKRSCGKHNCNQLCCIDIEHICPLPCSKTLSCGRHKCQERCHIGRCPPCLQSSFDELYCECGAEVIYPPVPCGTRRPICNRPCSRPHSCAHEVLHNCHSELTCPPCTVLTQRWCHGKHELRKAVPCHVTELSCGLPCNKQLSCGRHKCIRMCHAGSCEISGQQCTQPCGTKRELCGHICGAPCHEGKCPELPCKEVVKVTCQCGHRTSSRVCNENAQEYMKIMSVLVASKMKDMQLGHSIDLEEVYGQNAKKQNQLKTLECNDECKTIERNRRLALGLQIVNPDLSGKLMPRYTDYLKQWAKRDPFFCQMVHDKLTELVQLAKTSKQKSRSYSFEIMNREKRHFVHELCQHFGCESQAYDEEPKRNVVATAVKDKCWLPSYSLLEIVQREKGQRKVPGPILNTSMGNSSTKTVLSLPAKQGQQSMSLSTTIKTPDKEIDYFEYQG